MIPDADRFAVNAFRGLPDHLLVRLNEMDRDGIARGVHNAPALARALAQRERCQALRKELNLKLFDKLRPQTGGRGTHG